MALAHQMGHKCVGERELCVHGKEFRRPGVKETHTRWGEDGESEVQMTSVSSCGCGRR